MKTNNPPYLSIVIAARNDNYGGDFLQRLQAFVNWNSKLLEEYCVSTEIIIVNWNPIPDKPALASEIQWPKQNQYVCYRIITVDNHIHEIFANDQVRKSLPLFEYLAKNAGIGRAKGRFILAMNPDILIPSSIIQKISRKKLDPNYYYRANRLDFKEEISQPQQLWLKGFTYKLNCSLSPLNYMFLIIKNELRCIWRRKSVNYETYFKKKEWPVYYHNAEYQYHCNVSGDFMLMSREAWQKIKGNPENTFLPLHTDALTVVMTASIGLRESVFYHPIYHKDHQRRFDATEKANNENLQAYLSFQEEAQKMINDKKAIIYNDDNWGLRNFDLPEIVIK